MADTDGRSARAVMAITTRLKRLMSIPAAEDRARQIVQIMFDYNDTDPIGDIRELLRPLDFHRPGIKSARLRARLAVDCYSAWLESGRPQ